jgi:hypothetical protein
MKKRTAGSLGLSYPEYMKRAYQSFSSPQVGANLGAKRRELTQIPSALPNRTPYGAWGDKDYQRLIVDGIGVQLAIKEVGRFISSCHTES